MVPAGSFTMGWTQAERAWAVEMGDSSEWVEFGKPRHRVTIPAAFAVGQYEVTRGDFAAFVADSGHATGKGCWIWDFDKTEWAADEDRDWRDPGYSQSDAEPAVCINWKDAKAYVSWLSRETGKGYRLLSEAEWEYAARGGSLSMRYWGDDLDNENGCVYANVLDRTRADALNLQQTKEKIFMCRDGEVYTAPVGSYRPNGFDLHDMLGNVWEWVEDCWHKSYAGAPTDGRAWTSGGECSRRVLRGGSWYYNPRNLRAANRYGVVVDDRIDNDGFRVARTLFTP